MKLLLDVRFRTARYLFPFLPASAVIAGWALMELLRRVSGVYRLAGGAVLALTTLACTVQASVDTPWRRERLGRYGGPYYDFGERLQDAMPAAASVVADRRVYLPYYRGKRPVQHHFERIRVEKENPDVIVIEQRGTGRFAWPKRGTKLADRNWSIGRVDGAREVREALEWLVGESGYVSAYEEEMFIVFARPELAAEVGERMNRPSASPTEEQ